MEAVQPVDVYELRASLRDVVALTALPALWTGRSASALAESLADAVLAMLRLDGVRVHIEPSPGGATVDAHRGADCWGPARADAAPHIVRIPIGHAGALGWIDAAAGRQGFPTSNERLLLGVAANQAAVAVEGVRLHGELARKEQELADHVESAAIGMHWVGPDGTILWANRAEMELLGYAPSEYVGRDIAEFHVDRSAIEDILARLTRREILRNYHARMRSKDGSIKHVRIDSSVRWDGDRFVHTRCFTRDVTEQALAEQRLAVQYETARALAESETLPEAGARILAAICETLRWSAGLLWIVDPDGRRLRCVETWTPVSAGAEEFVAISRTLTFAVGEGLPGRVWASGAPAWIPDVLVDAAFSRTQIATAAGLRGAFAFPVRSGERVLGVIEFFGRDTARPDHELLDMMAATGG